MFTNVADYTYLFTKSFVIRMIHVSSIRPVTFKPSPTYDH